MTGMWWLKALLMWAVFSIAVSGLIGRFVAGNYIRTKPKLPSEEARIQDRVEG
jgi:hypothetical protein